jgi:hypothetical protein
VKKTTKRISQNKMWEAARIYRKEAEKCYKARAYFSAIVARACELEALLRIFDFVENRRPKDRCQQLKWLIDRAFARHWIPHDALRYWKRVEHVPLKTCLHDIREARNGVHAHLFNKNRVTRQAVTNITIVVDAMFSLLEIKNARNFMKHLHEAGEISDVEYKAWKKKQKRIAKFVLLSSQLDLVPTQKK